jgi:predicted CXXCH cytochrome family protein
MRVFITARLSTIRVTCQGVVFLVLLLTGLPTVGLSADFQGCRRCHQAELDQAEIRLNQHLPFMQKKCAACHATEASASGLQTGTVSMPARKTRTAAPKVTWLAESSQMGSEHSFVLPGDKLGDKLVVDLRGERERFPRQEISLPLLRDVEEVEKTAAEPKISAIKVLEVKRGVFLSVLIGWRTDALTDAQVHYGVQDLSQRSDRSKRYGHSHQVRLYNLKPDVQYRFQVVGTDLFGRSQRSEILDFSTEKPFEMKHAAVASRAAVAMQSSIQRLGNAYLVQLKTDKPTAVFVGSIGKFRIQKDDPKQPATVAATAHDGLSTGIDLGIAACLNCHRQHAQTTHPVNVLPKPGMTIPPEYPTLPDGRITCASCHLTHSSDYEYLAIRRGKRELCVGCHKDML